MASKAVCGRIRQREEQQEEQREEHSVAAQSQPSQEVPQDKCGTVQSKTPQMPLPEKQDTPTKTTQVPTSEVLTSTVKETLMPSPDPTPTSEVLTESPAKDEFQDWSIPCRGQDTAVRQAQPRDDLDHSFTIWDSSTKSHLDAPKYRAVTPDLINIPVEEFLSPITQNQVRTSIRALFPNGPPIIKIRPLRRTKKNAEPHIAGCTKSNKVCEGGIKTPKSLKLFKGGSYGITATTNWVEEEEPETAKCARRGPHSANKNTSAFNSQSNEIAERLKLHERIDKLLGKTPREQPAFSPLPSTSTDNKTIMENDKHYFDPYDDDDDLPEILWDNSSIKEKNKCSLHILTSKQEDKNDADDVKVDANEDINNNNNDIITIDEDYREIQFDLLMPKEELLDFSDVKSENDPVVNNVSETSWPAPPLKRLKLHERIDKLLGKTPREQPAFSPLPSTSTDNKTIMENDKHYFDPYDDDDDLPETLWDNSSIKEKNKCSLHILTSKQEDKNDADDVKVDANEDINNNNNDIITIDEDYREIRFDLLMPKEELLDFSDVKSENDPVVNNVSETSWPAPPLNEPTALRPISPRTSSDVICIDEVYTKASSNLSTRPVLQTNNNIATSSETTQSDEVIEVPDVLESINMSRRAPVGRTAAWNDDVQFVCELKPAGPSERSTSAAEALLYHLTSISEPFKRKSRTTAKRKSKIAKVNDNIDTGDNNENAAPLVNENEALANENTITVNQVQTSDNNILSPQSGGSLGECPVCFENLKRGSIASTYCGHVFCLKCIKQSMKTSGKTCPTCRKQLKGLGYHQVFL